MILCIIADAYDMKTYSMDLRTRVLQACLQKHNPQREIAKTYNVSISWLEAFLRRYRKTGSSAPLPKGGDKRSVFTDKKLLRLKELVDEKPDMTLAELQSKCGVKCSHMAVWRALNKLGYTRKKRRYVLASKTGQT